MTYITARVLAREAKHEYVLNEAHGPAPINIFKQLRLGTNLSLQGLAVQTGLSKVALIRAEQGTFANPPELLMHYWVTRPKSEHSELDLVQGYEDYQYYQRKRHLFYFGTDLGHQYDVEDIPHIFRQLRHNRPSVADGKPLPVSLDQSCRDLCLPPDTIRFWEKRFRNQQSVPKQVVSVLLFLGYTQSDVQQFSRDYVKWRLDHKAVKHG